MEQTSAQQSQSVGAAEAFSRPQPPPAPPPSAMVPTEKPGFVVRVAGGVKGGVVRFFKGVKALCGPIFSWKWWAEAMQKAAAEALKEMVKSFFKAFGGALSWYGDKKISPDSEIREYMVQKTQAQTPAAAAFSRGFQPQSEYRTVSSYPAPAPHPADQNFPGFGSNR